MRTSTSVRSLACFSIACWALSLGPRPSPAAGPAGLDGEGPWVVRVYVSERAAIDRLASRLDLWAVVPEEGHALFEVGAAGLDELLASGLRVELAEEHTAQLRRVGVLLPGQQGGIPGFPCYRTVEETHATAEAIAAARPDLAAWLDVGDSWEKTQDPGAGYDLRVLRLGRASGEEPKPTLFVNTAIHAREYTTAELGTRFAEFLVAGYGADPDVTWILDHHEIHLNLQANPDGRKRAEAGLSWRKNTNDTYCTGTDSRGADLNRNFEFQWGCCGGSSGDPCSSIYRGIAPASEPEDTAVQAYLRSIFPDQRPGDLVSPAPSDATGIVLDVHSFGEDVLWSWGFTTTQPPAPNGAQLYTLGRKYGFFTDYRPQHGSLSTVDGSTKDFAYGELGVPGFTIELGTTFFQDCASFESTILPDNLAALVYMAKVVRTPYQTPAGPEAVVPLVTPPVASAGQPVVVSALLDDTRYTALNGVEPSQAIVSAELFVVTPPWAPGAVALSMTAADGSFDSAVEGAEATLDTTGLETGRHLVYVRGTDAAGNVGPVSAAFLEIVPPGAIFSDGFESGNLALWSAAVP